MENELEILRAKGQTPRPKRQLGAWQSFETTPFSMLQDLLMVADARIVYGYKRGTRPEIMAVTGALARGVRSIPARHIATTPGGRGLEWSERAEPEWSSISGCRVTALASCALLPEPRMPGFARSRSGFGLLSASPKAAISERSARAVLPHLIRTACTGRAIVVAVLTSPLHDREHGRPW